MGVVKLQRRPHLLNWSLVSLDKKDEHLGSRKLPTLNKALLGKWSWRFASENEAL